MDDNHDPDVPTTYVPPYQLTQKHHFAGAGLSGSAPSYARLLQALLRAGELDGQRILSKESVDLMFQPHLTEEQRKGINAFPVDAQFPFVPTDHRADVGSTFGFGGLLSGKGLEGPHRRSPGSLTWDGICTTYFVVDRTRDVAFCTSAAFRDLCASSELVVSAVFGVNAFPWKARKVLDCLGEVETALYKGLK